MVILGITGGIATGKSTITAMLADNGVPTLSADTIAHRQMQPGTAVTQAVLASFPECVDSTQAQGVNRQALAQLIFSDESARLRLEALTHPSVIEALQEAVQAWRKDDICCAALEIPLLFEAQLETLVDWIVVAACRPQTQIARLSLRSSIDIAEAERRIAAQWPLKDKVALARTVINTDGSMDDTRRQVELLWKESCQ